MDQDLRTCGAQLFHVRRLEGVRVADHDARRIAQRPGLQCPAVGTDHQLRRTAEQTINVCPGRHVSVGDDQGVDHTNLQRMWDRGLVVDSLRWYEPDQVPRVCGWSALSAPRRRSPVPCLIECNSTPGAAPARLGHMSPVPPAVQRVLDAATRKGVQLQVREFDRSTHTAAEAAAAVGAEVGQIVKSLVFVADGTDGMHACLVLASGANTVDLGLLAAALTEPNIRRATADEARELTGFTIGCIP